jgi:hypothetical protein
MAVDPQEVCGAATCALCQPRDIKPEHVARGELRQAFDAEKSKNPLLLSFAQVTEQSIRWLLCRIGL